MSEEYRAKIFKSGNSLALRLPKGLGLEEGEQVRILREEPASFKVELANAPKRTIDLSGIWGACPDLKPSTPEDRMFDDPPRVWDDPDWPGWAPIER